MILDLRRDVYENYTLLGCYARIVVICYQRYGTDSYRVADKSLARPGMKQATATEYFDVRVSYS